MVFSSDPAVVHANIPYEVVDSNEDDDEGHCIWYGQCGPGYNPETNLNCPATNETRNAPKLTDPEALKILQKYCPDWYHGKTFLHPRA